VGAFGWGSWNTGLRADSIWGKGIFLCCLIIICPCFTVICGRVSLMLSKSIIVLLWDPTA